VTVRAAPHRPWLEPYAQWESLRSMPPARRLEQLNRLADDGCVKTVSGIALKFVDAATLAPAAPSGPALAYERHVGRTGEVPTRIDGAGWLHDLYNALVWLRFPRSKACLNAIQAEQIARHGIGSRRGAVRDAVTLFDENALLWVCDDPPLNGALREFDWQRLFVAMRERLAGSARAWVFGHALLEKLEAPYKSITAHAWVVPLPPHADAARVDAALAARLGASPPDASDFCPLPVMGLPGWCEDNDQPAFYDDRSVFRRGRLRPGRPREAADVFNDPWRGADT
jgi:hypothetical protein